MTDNFHINLPNGKALTAMTHPDIRSFVQRLFTNFNPNSGEVSAKVLFPIDCATKSASEQYPSEFRKQYPQLWLNHQGSHYMALPFPDVNGRTQTILIPTESLKELGETLVKFGETMDARVEIAKQVLNEAEKSKAAAVSATDTIETT